MVGSSLFEFLPDALKNDNIWQENLRSLLNDWIEETCDTEQPVPAIEEYLYEAFADQRRSKDLGNGVFLSTVHSVKGLEFDHVFILDGGWSKKKGDDAEEEKKEEERRLFYVVLSRARETLSLFSISNAINPHSSLLAGEFMLTRSLDVLGVIPQAIYEPVDLLPFVPISSLYENNNPRNINYMPVVVFFVCLDLEPKS